METFELLEISCNLKSSGTFSAGVSFWDKTSSPKSDTPPTGFFFPLVMKNN